MLQYVDLPSMVFSLDVVQTPHPIVSIRCVEMSAFPLEWFYRPFFDIKHMRMLLVRFFCTELHFMGDEVHLHVAFQMPKFAALFKRVLKAFYSLIQRAVFSRPDADPFPVCLNALGRDFAVLEAACSDSTPCRDTS